MRDLARLFAAELGVVFGDQRPAGPTATAEPQAGTKIDLEEWAIFDPKRQKIVVAYVDGDNQQRWVPRADEPGVPKTWRKLYAAGTSKAAD